VNQVRENLAVRFRSRIADGVGEIDRRRARLDGSVDDSSRNSNSVRLASSGENSMSFVYWRRLFDRFDADADDLFLPFAQLVLAMDF